MLNPKEKISCSKFLSLILRHKPEVANITLDSHGWADIDTLLREVGYKYPIDKEDLFELVETDQKGRYSISEDGTKIRANQGHSINVDVDLENVIPPEYLYHGTSLENLTLISTSCILPMSRQYVHLSKDESTAYRVGRRHGEPVVLRISAEQMHKDGFEFLKSVNGVFMTKYVPCEYVEVLEFEPEKKHKI